MSNEISPGDKRGGLLKEVNRTLVETGMTREDYEAKKALLVAPGWSVEEFIELGFRSGQLAWVGDMIKFFPYRGTI